MSVARFLVLALASLVAGWAVPAAACRYSAPIFSAGQTGRHGGTEVKVHVAEVLVIEKRIVAVRGTVAADRDGFRSGQPITVVVPRDAPEDCYYFGFAARSTVRPDGSMLAYVFVDPKPLASGAFFAAASSITDRSRYERWIGVQQRPDMRWTPARFDLLKVDPEEAESGK